MLKSLKALALAGLASVMMTGAGAAATVYDATSTYQNHAFWFGNANSPFTGSKSWQFIGGPGIFTKYEQGGMNFASLTGTIQQNGGTRQLKVDATFKERGVGDAFSGNMTGSNGTKCGAVGSAGPGNCNGDDTWTYYNYDSVLLTGLGSLDGLTLELSDHTGGNIPAQLGFGANDKDTGFGFSTWFDWEVTKVGSLTGYTVGDTGKGDINIKLGNERDGQDPEPVPLPAGGVLLLTALGGLGLARRRKRQA